MGASAALGVWARQSRGFGHDESPRTLGGGRLLGLDAAISLAWRATTSRIVLVMFLQGMADYSRPQPVDPLSYRMDAFLRIRCVCYRSLILPLGDLARMHRLPGNLCLYQLIKRLRCSECGARPTDVDVSRYPHWGRR